MRIFLKLVSAIIQTVEPSQNEKKRSKVFYTVMSFIAVFGIFIPICLLVGIITYALTKGFAEVGESTNGVMLFMHIISVFSFIFGLNVIFTVFYFSEDVETLLPLPLHPWQIIASRFTAALISESVMQIFVVLAALAGYLIAAGLPWYSWLLAIVAVVTSPILPLIYCSVLCMVVMAFTRWIRNKDMVNRITGVFVVLLIGGIVSCVSFVYNMDMQSMMLLLADKNSVALQTLNMILPHTQFIISAIAAGNILNFLIYIGILIAAIVVFMLLAQLLYFKGVLNSNQVRQKHDNGTALHNYFRRQKQSSPEWAYFKKELRILLRTPAYFMNCILISFVWPIFIYLVYLLQGPTRFLERFAEGVRSGNTESTLYYLLVVSAVSVLVTAANSIASSSLSREGKFFSFVKYIPMSYDVQIRVKASVAIFVSGLGMLVYTLAAGILLGINWTMLLFSCLLSLLSVVFSALFGVYMDSVNPKLVWDDELNVLRGNYNIFFNMAVAMVMEAVLCVGSILLYRMGVPMLAIAIALMLLLLFLAAVGVYLCKTKAVKHIEDIQF
ncbi:MAG: hypothetical protein ACI4M3_01650 [Acutalibacteraceae bacterium]